MKKMIRVIIVLFTACCLTFTLSGQQVYETLLRSIALVENDKAGEAVDLLSSALNEKQDSRLYIERAETFIKRGDYHRAMADFNNANELLPNSGDYGLSVIYALKGDAVTSLYHLERHLKSQFRKAEKEVLPDPAFSTIENTPEWRQFWKTEWYTSLETGISELEYYINSGMREDAYEKLSEIENIYRGNDEVFYAKALLNFTFGNSSEALKLLTELISSYPDNEKYLRLTANVQKALSNHAGASVIYTRMLENEVTDASLYLLRAECFQETGETKKAQSDIEKYLSFYPKSKKALQLSGKVYSASGDYRRALECFSENLLYHPGDPECYIDRADTYLLSRSWDWAMKDYSMSLDLDPSNSEVWLNKGITLINMGKTDDACHDFRKSFDLGNKKAINYLGKHCIK